MSDTVRLKATLAELTRAAYISCRERHAAIFTNSKERYVPGPRWDGGRGSDNKMYKSVWVSIVHHALSVGANPVQAVFALFERYRKAHEPPKPNLLQNADRIRELMADVPDVAESCKNILNSDRKMMAAALVNAQVDFDLDRKTALTMVLVDSQETWSPLMRYCIAVRENMPDIADRFREAAVLQYISAPDVFDDLYDSDLPQEISNVGKALKAAIC